MAKVLCVLYDDPRATLAYGFEELHLSRLICLIDPANEASVKVAMKIGMSLERESDIDGASFAWGQAGRTAEYTSVGSASPSR